MNILGILSFQGHTASAVLLKEGQLIAAAAEERFSRIKHDGAFPLHSINYVLAEGGIEISDVDEIAFAWNPYLNVIQQFKLFLTNFPGSLNYAFKKRELNGQVSRFHKLINMLRLKNELKKSFGFPPPFIYVPHHTSHSFSSYIQSGFTNALSVVMDGMGDFVSTSIYTVKAGEHTLIHREFFPHSIGTIYSSVTQYLGFRPDYDEYKIMGLCSYGENTYLDKMRDLVTVNGPSCRLNLKYFKIHRSADQFYSAEFARLLENGTGKKADIARSIQSLLEESVVKVLKNIVSQRVEKIDNFCASGGVFLNCLLNQKIRESGLFKNCYFSPVASDVGCPTGAAQYIHTVKTGKLPTSIPDQNLGPEYSVARILRALENAGLRFTEEENLAQSVARLLSTGKVVAWFQGRMEFGPRALGNRSILADPRKPEMKDKINAKVKRREPFRPFALSIMEEYVPEYFILPDQRTRYPFMIETLNVHESKRHLIPAVVHADGTSRLQSVNATQNSEFYKVISEFFKITNIPVILNTSFNVNKEPIVNTPEDAIKCFLNSGVDCLAIGTYLVSKD